MNDQNETRVLHPIDEARRYLDETKAECAICGVQQEDVGSHADSPPLCPVCYIRTVDPAREDNDH